MVESPRVRVTDTFAAAFAVSEGRVVLMHSHGCPMTGAAPHPLDPTPGMPSVSTGSCRPVI